MSLNPDGDDGATFCWNVGSPNDYARCFKEKVYPEIGGERMCGLFGVVFLVPLAKVAGVTWFLYVVRKPGLSK